VRPHFRGCDVVDTLERVTRELGRPKTIRLDKGPEFVSRERGENARACWGEWLTTHDIVPDTGEYLHIWIDWALEQVGGFAR
jgi:hypothetical protein